MTLDERINELKSLNGNLCDCDTCAYCNININEEPCSNCSPSNCKYEPIEKEGRAKRSDTEWAKHIRQKNIVRC